MPAQPPRRLTKAAEKLVIAYVNESGGLDSVQPGADVIPMRPMGRGTVRMQPVKPPRHSGNLAELERHRQEESSGTGSVPMYEAGMAKIRSHEVHAWWVELALAKIAERNVEAKKTGSTYTVAHVARNVGATATNNRTAVYDLLDEKPAKRPEFSDWIEPVSKELGIRWDYPPHIMMWADWAQTLYDEGEDVYGRVSESVRSVVDLAIGKKRMR